MARSIRMATVCLLAVLAGIAVAAFAFTLGDAAHSDAALGLLAAALVAGNFAALRKGVAWAVRPAGPRPSDGSGADPRALGALR